MGFSDTVGNYFSNMLGNVEKAIIKVVDDGEGRASSGVILDAEDSKILRDSMESAYLNNPAVGNIYSISELQRFAADANELFAGGKQFTVQFNPATLQLNAAGGGRSEVRDYAKNKKEVEESGQDIGYKYEAIPFQVTMEVDLIFNKVDPNDAFTESLQSLGTFKGVYKTGMNIIGKNASHSVQNEIEGLIAATRVFPTCLMSFNWGKMCYCGILQNLTTNYTVFNPKGEPVAGTAHLSMVLIDEYINEKSLGKWLTAYAEAFKDPTTLGSGESAIGGSAFSNFTF